MPRLAEFHTVLLFTPQRSLGKREVSYQQEVCLADDDVSLSHSVFSDLVNAIRGLLGLNPKPRTNPPWASCQTPPAPSPPGAQGLRGAMHHFQSAPPSPTFIMVQGSSEKRGSGRTDSRGSRPPGEAAGTNETTTTTTTPTPEPICGEKTSLNLRLNTGTEVFHLGNHHRNSRLSSERR